MQTVFVWLVLLVCKVVSDFPLDSSNIQCVSQPRTGGHWTVGNTNYQLYDIVCSNNGTFPATSISLTLQNASQITKTWNLVETVTIDNVTTFNLTNFKVILHGQSFGGAGYVVGGSDIPEISSIYARGVTEYYEAPTQCSGVGLYFSALRDTTAYANEDVITTYVISFSNEKTSIINHILVDISTTSGSTIDEKSIFGMTKIDDNTYNITLSSPFLPGKSFEHTGFTLIGAGAVAMSCNNVVVAKGESLEHKERTVAIVIIAITVGTCLLIATCVTVIIYLRKGREQRKNQQKNLRAMAGRSTSHKYTKMSSF